MAQKIEDLQKLLNFIDKLANTEGNEWFKENLSKMYGKSISMPSSNIESKIDFIQGYLMLDGLNCIDYSGISEKKVRDQLSIDCIMMARFRLGKIDNKVDFEEVCRYAHYQAEELMNYYFRVRHNNVLLKAIKEIKYEINKKSNSKPDNRPRDFNASSFGSIPYKFKIQAFTEVNTISSKTKTVFYTLSDIRNTLSHRDSLSEKQQNEVYKNYTVKGLNKSFVPFDKLSEEEAELNKIGKAIDFMRLKDFESIWSSLDELKSIVIDSLQKHSTNSSKKATLGDLQALQDIKNKLEL